VLPVPGSIARESGRKGGLTKAALHDGREGTAAARVAFRDSFFDGHACKVCDRIDIPPDLPAHERRRRADALRRRHYSALALAKAQKKAATTTSSGGLAEGHGNDRSAD